MKIFVYPSLALFFQRKNSLPTLKLNFSKSALKGKIDFTALTKYTRWTIFTNRKLLVSNNQSIAHFLPTPYAKHHAPPSKRLTNQLLAEHLQRNYLVWQRSFSLHYRKSFALASPILLCIEFISSFEIDEMKIHLHWCAIVVADMFDDVHKVDITFSFLAYTLSMAGSSYANKH